MHWPRLLFLATIVSMAALSLAAAATTQPLIVAHRGASFDAPENTLASYREAFAQHADAIEGDFWLTKDGHVVDTHDESFKRCAGLDKKVGDLTLAEIKQLDVGIWKASNFAGERVPTLDDILAILPPGTRFFIEVKGGPNVVDAVARVIAAQSHATAEQLKIIAFDADNIAAAKRAMPTLEAFWLTDFKVRPGETTKHPTLAEVLATLDRIHADGLDARADLAVIDDAFVLALRARGYPLHVWTVDDPTLAKQMIARGAQSVTTDRPAFLRDALSK